MKKSTLISAILIISMMVFPINANADDLDDEVATLLIMCSRALKIDKYDVAIECSDDVLRMKPDSYEALSFRGVAYLIKGNYDRAIEDFEAVLRINPNLAGVKQSLEMARKKRAESAPTALFNQCFQLIKESNYDRAIMCFDAVLEIKPDYHQALTLRGAAYYAKGNYDRAIEDFEAVLRINPNDAKAKQSLEMARKKRAESAPAPSSSATPAASSFRDPRDGKTYKTVKIGSQTWMAENLNYEASGSKCYDNNPAYCKKYGRLYDWNTAKKACPAGWHLPDQDEVKALWKTAGDEKTTREHLKSKSGWDNNGNGLDSYGFSALPGGRYWMHIMMGSISDYGFRGVGTNGYWWENSERFDGEGHYIGISGDSQHFSSEYKGALLSVRCVRD